MPNILMPAPNCRQSRLSRDTALIPALPISNSRADRASPAPAMSRRSRDRLEAIWKTGPGLHRLAGDGRSQVIGMRYLVTAFLFLLVGGIEALIMRVQLAQPEAHAPDAGAVQRAVHDARRDDDLPVRAAGPVGFQQLSLAVAARLARHGVSAPQCAFLLDLSLLPGFSSTRAFRSARRRCTAGSTTSPTPARDLQSRARTSTSMRSA